MNHEVKRVPLDFGWPLNKVWEGYLMPDSLKERPCPAGKACERGQTSARAWVEEIARLALMLDDDMSSRGNDLYRLLRSAPGGGTHGQRPGPSADIREFVTGLAGGQTSARAWVEEIARLALMLDDDMSSRGNDLYRLLRSAPGGGTHGQRSNRY